MLDISQNIMTSLMKVSICSVLLLTYIFFLEQNLCNMHHKCLRLLEEYFDGDKCVIVMLHDYVRKNLSISIFIIEAVILEIQLLQIYIKYQVLKCDHACLCVCVEMNHKICRMRSIFNMTMFE